MTTFTLEPPSNDKIYLPVFQRFFDFPSEWLQLTISAKRLPSHESAYKTLRTEYNHLVTSIAERKLANVASREKLTNQEIFDLSLELKKMNQLKKELHTSALDKLTEVNRSREAAQQMLKMMDDLSISVKNSAVELPLPPADVSSSPLPLPFVNVSPFPLPVPTAASPLVGSPVDISSSPSVGIPLSVGLSLGHTPHQVELPSTAPLFDSLFDTMLTSKSSLEIKQNPLYKDMIKLLAECNQEGIKVFISDNLRISIAFSNDDFGLSLTAQERAALGSCSSPVRIPDHWTSRFGVIASEVLKLVFDIQVVKTVKNPWSLGSSIVLTTVEFVRLEERSSMRFRPDSVQRYRRQMFDSYFSKEKGGALSGVNFTVGESVYVKSFNPILLWCMFCGHHQRPIVACACGGCSVCVVCSDSKDEKRVVSCERMLAVLWSIASKTIVNEAKDRKAIIDRSFSVYAYHHPELWLEDVKKRNLLRPPFVMPEDLWTCTGCSEVQLLPTIKAGREGVLRHQSMCFDVFAERSRRTIAPVPTQYLNSPFPRTFFETEDVLLSFFSKECYQMIPRCSWCGGQMQMAEAQLQLTIVSPGEKCTWICRSCKNTDNNVIRHGFCGGCDAFVTCTTAEPDLESYSCLDCQSPKKLARRGDGDGKESPNLPNEIKKLNQRIHDEVVKQIVSQLTRRGEDAAQIEQVKAKLNEQVFDSTRSLRKCFGTDHSKCVTLMCGRTRPGK